MALKISKGVVAGAVKVLVYGVAGVGKTTFASEFPKPLFLDLDRGSEKLDVERISGLKDWATLESTLVEIVSAIQDGDFPYRTVVIDTADKATELCARAICERERVSSIEKIGYGKGYSMLATEFSQNLLVWLQTIVDSGINVVVVAHAMQRQAADPETSEAYDHWELKLPGKGPNSIGAILKEWSDMTLFAYLKVEIITRDGKKSARNPIRLMRTMTTAFADAKSRFVLADPLPFDYKEIAGVIPEGGKPDTALTSARKARNKAKKETTLDAPEKSVYSDLKALMAKGLSESDPEPVTEKELLKAIRMVDPEMSLIQTIEDVPEDYLAAIMTPEQWAGVQLVIHNNIRIPF